MANEVQIDKIVEAVMRELAQKGAIPGASLAGAPVGGSAAAGSGAAGSGATVCSSSADDALPEPSTRVLVPSPEDSDLLKAVVAATPARLGVWRAGPRPKTETLLKFRADHAAAVDAVFTEVSDDFLISMGLFAVETQAPDKDTYLTRPDLGRRLTSESINLIKSKCQHSPQVQVVVADGLSSKAVEANLKDILPALNQSLQQEGLKQGTPFFVRHARVAVMDDIGEALQPECLILLIGERPGLVTAESLSAYLCYRPRHGTIESDRTVISNIHRGGTPPLEAGAHLGTVAKKIIQARASGVKLAQGA